MQTVFSSNAGLSRDRLLAYLAAEKKADPNLKVVDIGGAYNPWTASVADCFVDINAVEGYPTIVGDIHDPALWREIKARNFGFCICSHTLEDIRDPLFVLARLRETFSHGYIAVPNKHVEFSNIESKRYVGFGHHRWIYTLAPDEFRLIAKFPFVSYYAPQWRALQAVRASAPAKTLRRWFGVKPHMRDLGPLPWWNAALAGPSNELAFVWKGELNYRAINADYAGQSLHDLARLYREELAEGL